MLCPLTVLRAVFPGRDSGRGRGGGRRGRGGRPSNTGGSQNSQGLSQQGYSQDGTQQYTQQPAGAQLTQNMSQVSARCGCNLLKQLAGKILVSGVS